MRVKSGKEESQGGSEGGRRNRGIRRRVNWRERGMAEVE